MASAVSSQISIPPPKLIPPFKFNMGFRHRFSTLVLETFHHMWHDWHELVHLMANIQSQGWTCFSPLKIPLKVTVSEHQAGGGKIPDYYVHKMMDRTYYVPLILPTTVCTAHIADQWWRCDGSQKSNGSLTLIMLHFWFTFESLFDYIRWISDKKEERKKEKTRSE